MISFREKNFMYSYNKMKPPSSFKTHLHKYYEFLYIVSGDASYIVEDNEYPACDGDLFITKPGEMHSIVFRSQKTYERHFIQISEEFLSDVSVDLLEKIRRSPMGVNNRITAEHGCEKHFEDYFLNIGSLLENRTAESDVLIKTYVIQLIAAANGLLSENDCARKTEENSRIAAAKQYIENNISSVIKLGDIAAAAYTNPSYLSRLFHKCTGLTVKEYITLRRVFLAKRLIQEGMDLKTVCGDCGFSDYSVFYRAFRRITGKSPGEFMK